jgi:hypothetical protein
MERTDILFVTAFKDIDRESWRHYRRTNKEYYDMFIKLASNIKYNMLVYVEDDIKDILTSLCSFNSNIIFKNMNHVFTFSDRHLLNDQVIMESETYKRKIPAHRSVNPEHVYSEYNFVNHNKINYVSNAKHCFPDYSFYSWIDFGYVRDESSIPRNINVAKLPHKIIYHCNVQPTTRIDPNYMLTSDCIFITGSSYIIHSSLVNTFEELYERKIKEWQANYITDDDQNLVLQLYFDYPDLFHLIQNKTWFSLYNIL